MTREEAVETIKKILPMSKTLEDAFYTLHSELRENEDDRIRKDIIKTISWIVPDCQYAIVLPREQKNEWLAWLEKQKEQNEIPLMNGDADLYFDEWNQQKQNPTKRQCFEEGMKYAQRLQKEQKSTEYIKRNSKEWYALLSEQYNKGYWNGRAGQNPRKFKLDDKVHRYDDDTNVITITGFRDDAYLTDSAYGPILFCDEDNWERIEQKFAEWSEEDEKMVRTIISDGSRGVELDSKQVDWLKSLKNGGNLRKK